MRLLWATDLHLEFTDDFLLQRFLSLLASTPCDAIVLTGDISSGRALKQHMLGLAAAGKSKPIYVVLGNHDFYHSSFAQVGGVMEEVCGTAEAPNLKELGHGEVIPLGEQSALIGHRGWGDGRGGLGSRSDVELNDFRLITDLHSDTKRQLFAKLASLGKASANYFRETLPVALAQYDHVWIATHVPPFECAAWHEGANSDPEYLPHFSNVSAGEAIREIAEHYPAKRITVLCGHTHSSGTAFPAPNIRVLTGGAVYGSPRIAAVLNPDDLAEWDAPGTHR